MQNVMHIATNAGHTAQNDGQTMQNDSRIKGGLEEDMPRGPPLLEKTLVSKMIFRTLRTKKNRK